MNEIYSLIKKDLSIYGQSNLAPSSITFDKFRHYELGSCFGLCAFDFGGRVAIVEIKEDDGYWFCFSDTDKNSFDAGWLKTKIDLYTRMQTWLDNNVERDYYYGHEGEEGFECGYTTTFK